MKTDWKNFKKEELVCSCCGTFNPNPEFQTLMDDVQKLRDICGFPFKITSAYRCPDKHPLEVKKVKPGQHTIAAVDIQVATPQQYFDLMESAILQDAYTGLGFSMKGDMNSRFIHLDQRNIEQRSLWSYQMTIKDDCHNETIKEILSLTATVTTNMVQDAIKLDKLHKEASINSSATFQHLIGLLMEISEDSILYLKTLEGKVVVPYSVTDYNVQMFKMTLEEYVNEYITHFMYH